jgi:hypothetical protein
MLGPKNTAADVADILIAGLLNGSISLDGEAPTSQPTRDAESDEYWRRRAEYLQAELTHARDHIKRP